MPTAIHEASFLLPSITITEAKKERRVSVQRAEQIPESFLHHNVKKPKSRSQVVVSVTACCT